MYSILMANIFMVLLCSTGSIVDKLSASGWGSYFILAMNLAFFPLYLGSGVNIGPLKLKQVFYFLTVKL